MSIAPTPTDIRHALHAEQTKLRTLPSTPWLMLTAIGVTVAVSAATILTSSTSAGIRDTTKLSLTGISLGQAVIAVLAVLAVSNEYSTGMLQTTLTAIPRRRVLVAAKATTVVCTVAAISVIAVAGCLVAGWLILPARGFTAAHGYALVSVAHSATLRAAIGSIVYLCLVALLSIGIAAIVRDTAAAVGMVLGLLYMFPILDQVVTNPAWHRHLEQIGPMTAGLAIQATTQEHALAISPWAGIAVLAAWAIGALIAGALVFQRRPA